MKKLLITGCARSGTGYISYLLRFIGLKLTHEKIDSNGIVSWYNAYNLNYIFKNNSIDSFIDTTSDTYPGLVHGKYNFSKKESKDILEWDRKYDFIIHQVRDPLKVISSMHATAPNTWKYIMKVVPEIHPDDPLTLKCVKYWYYWNKKAEKLGGHLMRIEDIEKNLPFILKEMNVENPKSFQEYDTKIKNLPKGHKYPSYEIISNFNNKERWQNMIDKEVNTTKNRPSYKKVTWGDIQNLDIEIYNLVYRLGQQYGYYGKK